MCGFSAATHGILPIFRGCCDVKGDSIINRVLEMVQVIVYLHQFLLDLNV